MIEAQERELVVVCVIHFVYTRDVKSRESCLQHRNQIKQIICRNFFIKYLRRTLLINNYQPCLNLVRLVFAINNSNMNADIEAAQARLAAKKKRGKNKRKISAEAIQQNAKDNIARQERKEQIKGGTDAVEVVHIDNVVSREIREHALSFLPNNKATSTATFEEGSTATFEEGSTHQLPTNADLITYSDFFNREAMTNTILLTIDEELQPGLTVKLSGLETRSNNNNSINFSIVDEKTYKRPEPTKQDMDDITYVDDKGVIHISPLLFPDKASISGHPSLRPYAELLGRALVPYLRSRGHVYDDLNTAPSLGEPGANKGAFGAYAQCEEDELSNSLVSIKSGFTTNYIDRKADYNLDAILKMLSDYSQWDIDTDLGVQCIVEKVIDEIRNDLTVPANIKHLFCEVIFRRGGGRYGGKDVFTGKAVETGFQYLNRQCVIGENTQYDDKIYYSMQGHILKTLAILEPSLVAIAERAKSQPVLSPIEWTRMSWPVAPHPNPKRADQLVHKPLVTGYTIGIGGDGSNIESAYDEPAIPGATTIEDRYSSDYGRGSAQTMKALDKISTLIKKKGAATKLLDKNETACDLGNTTMESLIETNSTYELTHVIYDGQIELHIDQDPSALLTHAPLCRSGDCRDFATLNVNGQGCMNVDTLRNVLLKCQGKPIDTRMLAVEAHMAQRLYKDGLGQDDRMKGLLVREYLAPKLQPLNKYGGNKHGPIPHYPLYPMADNNKKLYTRKL